MNTEQTPIKQNSHAIRRKYHYIYKTTCIISGRYYLGMHSTDDLDDGYLGSGKVLQYSIKKHGKENHVKEILEQHQDRKLLIDREKELITDEILNDPLCINLRYGGMPGMNVTEETRAKLSKAGKGRPHSAEHKARLSAAHTGKVVTEETKEKIGNKNRGRVQSDDERKMRSDAVNDKPAYNSRPVICNGVEFCDSQKAATALGLTPNQVKNYLASEYNMDFQYKDSPKIIKEKIPHGSKPVVIEGIEYTNKSDAGKALDMSIKMVHTRCVSDKYLTWNYKNVI